MNPINFFKKCPPVNSSHSSSSTDRRTESTFLYILYTMCEPEKLINILPNYSHVERVCNSRQKKKETKHFILNVAFHIHYELKHKHLKINYYLDQLNMTQWHIVSKIKVSLSNCIRTNRWWMTVVLQKKNIPEYKSSWVSHACQNKKKQGNYLIIEHQHSI